MRVYKSINNNIVSAYDDNDREVVVIGKGIGYKACTDDEIPNDKIEKIFIMSNSDNMERLKNLFETLPAEYIELTDEIIAYAKKRWKKRLNEGIYFTLADHINFAVARRKQGMEFQNVLLSEIRRFYPQEFDIGMYALKLMKQRLGVTMPEDEAASIALHIFNAEYDISVSEAFHSTRLLNNILEIIYKETNCIINEQSYFCERFYTHLKFLTQRIIKKEILPSDEDELFEFLLEKYPEIVTCSEKIAEFIQQEHDYELSKDEICNLTIHIKRVMNAK